MFKKAKVENIKAKVLLAGPSGSGKTYSALRMATGLVNGGKIGFIDSEMDRGKYYADQFEYYISSLEDHSPEGYIKQILEAEKAGIEVLIIDSISHEWKALMEEKDKMPGNSFTNFAKITPRHDKFLKVILQSKMHIICTVRAKDKYELQENNKGKMVPKKFGVGLEQRDTIEYEFTSVFHIDSDTHIPTTSKDNTGLFTEVEKPIDEETGIALLKWCDNGYNPELEEVGTEKATLLTDFLIKKKIEIEAAAATCKEYFNVDSFKELKMKDYKIFMTVLKKVNYKLQDFKI